jgi:sulfoxide reductase heme-binding subunit YedZ
MSSDDPILWYLNRSTGLVVLAMLTASVVLGILATGRGGRLLPRFVGQAFHRSVALWSSVLLVLHVVTAVVDSYVDIRWWQTFVPWWGASYLPLWLGFGTVAVDIVVLVVVTSWARARMRHRSWRLVHLLSYVAWGVAVAHGLGIGTDLRGSGWERTTVWCCVGAVAVLSAWRGLREISTARVLKEPA